MGLRFVVSLVHLGSRIELEIRVDGRPFSSISRPLEDFPSALDRKLRFKSGNSTREALGSLGAVQCVQSLG